MQNAKRSLLSFLLSVVIHATIIFLLFWSHLSKTDTSANSATGEISTSISMEMNPNLAGNGVGGSELDAYRSALRREIEKHKRYPARAKMMRKQGIVTVSFSIGADGSISGASIAKSSGAEDLDNAALSAVNSARSIGPRPAGMGPSITVPISFKIN